MSDLKNVISLQPFKHFCMSIGALPTSYLNSMSYYEMLLWFCNYLEKTVIPTINNNSECVKELQNLFTQLHDYVKNYFDNLDVQNEINIKLDKMASDGTLDNILMNFANVTKVYNTTIEMLEDSKNLVNNQKIRTLGYYNINDFGGSDFYISNSILNDKFYFTLKNGLFAYLIINDSVNIKQLGAIGDGVSDDTNSFIKALSTNASYIYIPKGIYYFSNFNINKNCTFYGYKDSILKNGYISISNNIDVSFFNLSFKDLDSRAFYINSSKVLIKNCVFDNITLNKSNLSSYGCIYANADNFDLTVENCKITNNHGYGAIYTYGIGKINILNNYIYGSDYRAIHGSASNSIEYCTGSISNNYIAECGINNTADTGAVGCNGIYAPVYNYVNVINNYILNSRENAIEGNFKLISGNYIDGTNVEIETKSTPSIEGIFVSNILTPCIIENNILKNIKRRGISSIQINDQNNKNLIIRNNYIEMIEYNNSLGYSIILQGSSVNNKIISNNIVNSPIIFTSSGKNSLFIGDIKDLADTSYLPGGITNNIHLSNCISFYSIDNLNGFTYSNCTPSIENIDSDYFIHIPYESSARLVSPKFNSIGRTFIHIEFVAKGNFEVRLYDGTNYKSTIKTINSNSFTKYSFDLKPIFINSNNDYKIRFQLIDGENSGLDLINFNYSFTCN